jgi:hypothetical protein
VSTPEELARQAAAVAEVRAARIQLLRDKIIKALNLGASVKDVAAAAELSRQRIHQIINEQR